MQRQVTEFTVRLCWRQLLLKPLLDDVVVRMDASARAAFRVPGRPPVSWIRSLLRPPATVSTAHDVAGVRKVGGKGSEVLGKRVRPKRHVSPNVELDHRVGTQRYRAWIAREASAIDVGGHVATVGGDSGGAERLAPDVEEVAERERPLGGSLDVDHAVGRVRVQPVEARTADGERPLLGLLDLRTGDADPERHLLLLPVVEDRQVRMNVEQRLLARLTLDSVDCLSRAPR